MTLLGHRLFGVAFIAFGLLQLLYGDFVPGRPQAWPEQVSGGWIWAYATGIAFVIAGAAILVDRYRTPAALSIAVLIFAWAVIRNLPLAVADENFGSPWTRLGKAVALTGGGVAVAASAYLGGQRSVTAMAVIGRVALGAFLIASGVQHFLFPGVVATLVPTWIPGALFWTYFAGLALIAGGAGLMLPVTTWIAGSSVGLMLLTWAAVLHIPRALLAQPANRRNEWTAVFEAIAFAGIALALARRSDARARTAASV